MRKTPPDLGVLNIRGVSVAEVVKYFFDIDRVGGRLAG